jgi:hypothetical protein
MPVSKYQIHNKLEWTAAARERVGKHFPLETVSIRE